MGKSEVRWWLADRYPGAFYDRCAPPEFREVDVVLDDSMQRLKPLADDDRVKSGRKLVDTFVKPLRMAFAADSSVKTWVFCVDKYPWVPVTKSVEQAERDAEVHVEPIWEGADHFEQMLRLDAKLPVGWTEAVRDRKRGSRAIIRFVMRHLLMPNQPFSPPVGRGRNLIMDGHYLQPSDLPAGSEAARQLANDADFADVRAKPWLLQRIPIELLPGHKVVLRRDLENQIGEGDFAQPFFLCKLVPDIRTTTNASGGDNNTDSSGAAASKQEADPEPRQKTVAVYSIDTDMFWILLRALERYDTPPRVLLRFWPQLTWSVNSNMFMPPSQKWCDLKKLRKAICDDAAMTRYRHKINSLAIAAVSGGGDYTAELPQVPHKYWLTAVVRFPEIIGELTGDNGVVNYESFERLHKCACAIRGSAGGRRKNADGTPAPKAAPRPPGSGPELHGTWEQALDKLPPANSKKNISKRYDYVLHKSLRYRAAPLQLKLRFLHLRLYFMMLDQSGNDTGKLIEPQPCLMGYERIDKTQPLMRGNISRMYDSSTHDMAMLMPEHDTTRHGEWGEDGAVPIAHALASMSLRSRRRKQLANNKASLSAFAGASAAAASASENDSGSSESGDDGSSDSSGTNDSSDDDSGSESSDSDYAVAERRNPLVDGVPPSPVNDESSVDSSDSGSSDNEDASDSDSSDNDEASDKQVSDDESSGSDSSASESFSDDPDVTVEATFSCGGHKRTLSGTWNWASVPGGGLPFYDIAKAVRKEGRETKRSRTS